LFIRYIECYENNISYSFDRFIKYSQPERYQIGLRKK